MDRYCFCHHKCASNWLRGYVGELCRRFGWRFQALQGGRDQSFNQEASDTFFFYWNSWPVDAEAMPSDARAIHLVRDPRDALVSGYWSWLKTHRENPGRIQRVREQLEQLSFEDGLLLMVDHTTSLEQLAGWDLSGRPEILTLRYEAMVADTHAEMDRALKHLRIQLAEEDISELVSAHSFSARTGRQPGDEDTNDHFRRGVAGDWRRVFTPRVQQRFEQRHGAEMRRLGYNW